jgi:hypothetical protein
MLRRVRPMVFLLSDIDVGETERLRRLVDGRRGRRDRHRLRGGCGDRCLGSPVAVCRGARAFVRGVVASAPPGTAARAKALLFAASKLAVFGESVGLELSPGVLLHPS